MSAATKKFRTATSSGTVVSFPSFGGEATKTFGTYQPSALIEQALNSALAQLDVRSAIENAVDRAVQESLWFEDAYDSPFDAIYLSDLEMDVVPAGAVETLRKYSGISDRSDLIRFPEE